MTNLFLKFDRQEHYDKIGRRVGSNFSQSRGQTSPWEVRGERERGLEGQGGGSSRREGDMGREGVGGGGAGREEAALSLASRRRLALIAFNSYHLLQHVAGRVWVLGDLNESTLLLRLLARDNG